MGNFVAVLQKELKTYLVSPIAYVVGAVFLLVSGFFFRNMVIQFNMYCMTYIQQAQRYGGQLPQLNLNEFVVNGFFGSMSFISLFVVPLLTMRLIAEEKKSGTMELLMTSPLSNVQTILGKFVSCFLLYTVIVGLSGFFVLLLEIYGNPDWGPIFSAYVGVLLMGGAFVAVGVFASSLTENQIVAAVLSFAALLIFWVIGWSANFAGPTMGKVLTYLSLVEHIGDFQKGIIDTKDVIFYLSFMFFSLFLTLTVMESRKWRK